MTETAAPERPMLDPTGPSTEAGAPIRQASLWRDAWRRYVRNRGAVVAAAIFLTIVAYALLAPVLSPHDPYKVDFAKAYQTPNSTHLLGTDQFGRDLFTRTALAGRISIGIGFGATIASPTSATSPTIHSPGWMAATIRPPSSGVSGARLNRLRKKPVNASATSRSESRATPAPHTAAAPRLPTIGPAIAIFASAQTSCGICFIVMKAPRNGMNIGALAGIP